MKQIIQSHIRLVISATDNFANAFGPGTAELLRGIQNSKSLNQTTKDMGMSYSKAWKSIRATEEELGVTLIERNGVNGSSLTKEGEEVLALFDRANVAAQEAVDKVLQEEAANNVIRMEENRE